jgi:DNA-directed RNA polymerase specialized sigma24 family protein
MIQYSPVSASALCIAAQAKDEDAYAELLARCTMRARPLLITSKLRNGGLDSQYADLFDNAVSDALDNVLKSPTLDPQRFEGFYYTSLRNAVTNVIRRIRNDRSHFTGDTDISNPAIGSFIGHAIHTGYTPDHVDTQKHEASVDFGEKLTNLKALYKRCLEYTSPDILETFLYALKGTYAESARMMEIPVGTVKSRVAAAHRALKAHDAELSHAYDAFGVETLDQDQMNQVNQQMLVAIAELVEQKRAMQRVASRG